MHCIVSIILDFELKYESAAYISPSTLQLFTNLGCPIKFSSSFSSFNPKNPMYPPSKISCKLF